MGSNTDKNMGVEYEIMKMVPNRVIKVVINDLKLLGICSSTELMSFTKRFTIRPNGVDSKNSIGQYSMRISNCLWSFLDAWMVPKAMPYDKHKFATAWPNPIPP